MARRTETTERPDPSDKAEVIDLAPGQTDHSFTLQAIMAIGRDVATLSAKLDRVIQDNKDQGDKLDELRHQVSFVRGAIWIVGGIVAIAAFLIGNNVHLSFGGSSSPPAASAPAPAQQPSP